MARWRERYNRNTLSAYRRALKRLAHHIGVLAGLHDLSTHVPSVPSQRPRTTIATPDELARLTAAAPGWMTCLMQLCLTLGLRLGDSLSLAPANWNDQAHTITLRQQKTRQTLVLPTIPALEQLLSLAPPGDPTTPYVELFRGGPVSKHGAQAAWTKLKRRTQVNPELHLHDLRRTAGVTLYELTKDIRAVQQFLGHASLSSAAHYLEHRDPTKLRPFLEAMWRPKTETKQ